MKKLSSRRPSPAMVVAVIALIAALGGSAYAAKKIGTKEIKNNAITAAKIKKNAITAPKIKEGAVTGAKIDEKSLAPVPNATHAATADKATTAVNAENAVKAQSAQNALSADNAANWSRYSNLGLTKASHGQTVTLHTVGPFTIYGQCVDAGSGESEAYTYATTSQPASSFASYEDYYYNADFDPGTKAEINYPVQSAEPETNMAYSYYGKFYLASADGGIRASGDLYSGVNYFGASCAFWGNITNES